MKGFGYEDNQRHDVADRAVGRLCSFLIRLNHMWMKWRSLQFMHEIVSDKPHFEWLNLHPVYIITIRVLKFQMLLIT